VQADDLVAFLRWFFLFAALFNLVVVIFLYRWLIKPIVEWFLRLYPARVTDFGRFAFSETVHRVCGAIGVGVCLLLWWYLGSDAGRSLAASLVRAFAER
jgi:hypothetical protein